MLQRQHCTIVERGKLRFLAHSGCLFRPRRCWKDWPRKVGHDHCCCLLMLSKLHVAEHATKVLSAAQRICFSILSIIAGMYIHSSYIYILNPFPLDYDAILQQPSDTFVTNTHTQTHANRSTLMTSNICIHFAQHDCEAGVTGQAKTDYSQSARQSSRPIYRAK